MMKGRPIRWPFQLGLAIETGMEDRLHTLIRARISIAGSKCSGLQSIRTISLSQTQDSQTRAEALFRVRARLQDLLDQTCGGWPNARRPVDQPLGRPFQVALMGLRPMG